MKKSTNLKSGGFVTRMIWNYARNIKFHPTPKNTKTETKKRAKKNKKATEKYKQPRFSVEKYKH